MLQKLGWHCILDQEFANLAHREGKAEWGRGK